MLLGAIGLCTESGEIMDVFKKALYHGRKLDTVNLKEELGDLLWYLAILMRELNLDLDEVLEINIRKLRLRYGNKFDASKSLSRDTLKERQVLEN
jgi:NTP pyrophosphatase (non-canonical NTP hydrolase)